MRILQLSSASSFGGGERHLVDLSNMLAARGHQVFAALRPGSHVRERLTLPDANVVTLPLRNALDLASASKLARFARGRGVEIVHAHLARDYPVASLAVRRAPPAKLVITRHVPFAMSAAHRLALSNVARVVAVSEGVARGLRERRIFPEEKVRVVPNGVDFAAYDEALRGFDRDAYRRETLQTAAPLLVGTVGDLSETKGQDVFLRAAALVARRVPGAEFVIVGEDKSKERGTLRLLERLIDEGGLRGRVRLHGYAPDLPRLLASLDLYVSASRAEAFGLATLEAMICGAAVVATATDGSREMVRDGETGRLVPIGDAAAIAEAVASLLGDDGERRRLRESASADVRARFSLGRMVDATEEVYREALENTDGR